MRPIVSEIIQRTLEYLKGQGDLSFEEMPAFAVEAPKNAAHGDFAVNVAMMLAKPERKKPRDIAQLIVDGLQDPDKAVSQVEIAGPGFLNFRLSDHTIQNVARDVLRQGEQFGRRKTPTGKRVMVEFVSANPTGPLHLGHARGAYMGDALARLLDAAGHEVTREFYINDHGNQIETLGRTVYKRYLELLGQTIELAPGEYPAAYVIDIAKALLNEDGDKWLEQEESAWLPRCIEIGIRENLREIRETLERLNISHDVWFSERSLHESGKVLEVVDAYRNLNKTYEAEQARGTDEKVRREGSKAAAFTGRQLGGTFLETSAYGDDEDRVILRQDGTAVYLTADLAYHKDKYDRGYDRMIDVWGADHAGHVPRIRAGMQALGLDSEKLDFVLVQIVRLMRDGEEVRFSKRSGQVYRLDEFADEVGHDAVRFVFLMRGATAQFDFDLNLIREQSNQNPVFYLQYGHARTVNVMRRAEESGAAFVGVDKLEDKHLDTLVLPEERTILKKISTFPELVSGAADALEPHRVLYYCQDLISDFHGYFTKYRHTERIVSDDVAKTQGRLAMVAALRMTLKNALGLIGIHAPDYMEPPKEDEDTAS